MGFEGTEYMTVKFCGEESDNVWRRIFPSGTALRRSPGSRAGNQHRQKTQQQGLSEKESQRRQAWPHGVSAVS